MRAGTWGILVVTAALVAPMAACRADDQRTESVTPDVVRSARERLDPRLVALLDSGNAAMRGEDPSGALEFYRRAAGIDGSSAAAWFGVYMASEALGLEGEAEEALERARALAPGASLLDPDTVPRR